MGLHKNAPLSAVPFCKFSTSPPPPMPHFLPTSNVKSTQTNQCVTSSTLHRSSGLAGKWNDKLTAHRTVKLNQSVSIQLKYVHHLKGVGLKTCEVVQLIDFANVHATFIIHSLAMIRHREQTTSEVSRRHVGVMWISRSREDRDFVQTLHRLNLVSSWCGTVLVRSSGTKTLHDFYVKRASLERATGEEIHVEFSLLGKV